MFRGTPLPTFLLALSKLLHPILVILSFITKLTDKVSSSSSDIREDVIARAEKLLNDPNWLSDENLDRLASRLIDNEDFNLVQVCNTIRLQSLTRLNQYKQQVRQTRSHAF